MKATCFSGGIIEANGSRRTTTPFFARTNPTSPATAARIAITPSNTRIGRIREAADRLGRLPVLAAIATEMPTNAPTHHVAITPQPRPSNVGESVLKTGG